MSEFGPRGYWDPKYNRTAKGSRVEDSDKEKAEWYKEQWSNYVYAYKKNNVGGFAYCWHDRMEGSYTWFGLSDYKGRLKPSYFALKELWTNTKETELPDFRIEMPGVLIPGKEYEFTAVSDSRITKDLTYEWLLLKDEYLDKTGDPDPSEDGRKVTVTIPEKASHYRLYLFVSDADKNVTTASASIIVKDQYH